MAGVNIAYKFYLLLVKQPLPGTNQLAEIGFSLPPESDCSERQPASQHLHTVTDGPQLPNSSPRTKSRLEKEPTLPRLTFYKKVEF